MAYANFYSSLIRRTVYRQMQSKTSAYFHVTFQENWTKSLFLYKIKEKIF